MDIDKALAKRRIVVVLNYLCLIIMNVCFYFVYLDKDMSHAVDAVGLGALVLVVLTFIGVHTKTGLWKLTHAKTSALDERELQITHNALNLSYGLFTVISLAIILTHAVLYRLLQESGFVISVPLAGSLIYLAHTLPGSILAWTEKQMPREVQ
jgi:hypothetical protein